MLRSAGKVQRLKRERLFLLKLAQKVMRLPVDRRRLKAPLSRQVSRTRVLLIGFV